MIVSAQDLSVEFGEGLNAVSMKMGSRRASFDRGSECVLCGMAAQIENAQETRDGLTAKVANGLARGTVSVSGGEAISVCFELEATDYKAPEESIPRISISLPLPVDIGVHISHGNDDAVWDVSRLGVGDSFAGPGLWDSETHTETLLMQFCVVEWKGEWIRIGTRSAERCFPRMSFRREESCTVLTWTWMPPTPFPKRYTTPPLRFEAFDTLEAAVADHRKWAHEAFSYRELAENPYAPKWLHNVRLVVNLGLWATGGRVIQDFDDARRLVAELARVGAPKDTILYIWGWSFQYDGHYPEYWPAQRLGGEMGFSAFVDAAHEAGFRVMPHTNYWAMDPRLPDFPEYETHQSMNSSYTKRGYPVEACPILFIRPCAESWRTHVAEKITAVRERFDLDAVFFDQAFAQFNDPECNYEAGIRSYMAGLHEANPEHFDTIARIGLVLALMRSEHYCRRQS